MPFIPDEQPMQGFVPDSFEPAPAAVPPQSQPQPESALQRIGNKFGNILQKGADISGASAAVGMASPILEGVVAAGLPQQARQRYLTSETPASAVVKKGEQKGTVAALKDIAGKGLETAAIAAPYAKGAGLGIKIAPHLMPFVDKFPNLARYAGYATRGAGYGATFGAANALQEENKKLIPEVMRGAGVGALIGVAIPAVIEGTVRAVKNMTALYSGVPKQALEIAFQNPEKVGHAAREYAKSPEAVQDILNKANSSIEAIKQTRAQAYEQALRQIGPEDTARLNLEGMYQNFDTTMRQFKMHPYYSSAGVSIDFTRTPLPKSEQRQIQELAQRMFKWKDTSALGMNDLRQIIDSYYSPTASRQQQKIIMTLRNNLSDYVGANAPKIAEMNAAYAESSKFLDRWQKEFGSDKLRPTAKLQRLLMIFKRNSPEQRELVRQLGNRAGTDLMNEITGAAMSDWLPTGWVQRFVLGTGELGIGSAALIGGGGIVAALPGILGAAAAASPRIVGKGVRVSGQLSRLAIPGFEKVGLQQILKQLTK